MNYLEFSKSKGVKLELSVHDNRSWKKMISGKIYYFSHPLTKEGYQAALQEFYLLKAKIDGNRKHHHVYKLHIDLFSQVAAYYSAFGVPSEERLLARQINKFVKWANELLLQPVLTDKLPILGFSNQNTEFQSEFIQGFTLLGTDQYQLPDKWQDRLNRLTPQQTEKLPQTIDFWLSRFRDGLENRIGTTIQKKSAKNVSHKLESFRQFTDLQNHISTINNDFLDKFHKFTEKSGLAKKTKTQYFKTVKQFLKWASVEDKCDLVKPSKLDSSEYRFREPDGTGRKRLDKKLFLWTVEEIATAMTLPQPYKCFVLCMLNCGFRHVDLSELQHRDIDYKSGRIIIQRNKLNQLDTAPVINYRLWDVTLQSINEIKTSKNEKFVFQNEAGGQVENSIKTWWGRNRSDYGLSEKRLDYIRKTGSSIIKDCVNEMYLGESLSTTTSIHYAFKDGEINKDLDKEIAKLGAKFGFCEEPAKTIELTPEIEAALRKAKLL